jgi:hypothetical protein
MAKLLNPTLEPLAFLIGDWITTGTHPMVPGETLRGRASFAWHEGGAFLIMRSEVDHPLFPTGISIFGSDGNGRSAMIYYDERGVSRIFDVELGDRTVTWRRDDPEFAQSTTLTADSPDRLTGIGRMSIEGGAWADDLSQVYTRHPGAIR